MLDEQQALQMAFTSLEEKFRRLYDENNDLVARWMILKSQAADRVNEDNETQMKVKQDKLKQELAEAATDYVTIIAPTRLGYITIVVGAKSELCQYCCN